MTGNSWLAVSQWFAAAEQPPHLACIAPWDGFITSATARATTLRLDPAGAAPRTPVRQPDHADHHEAQHEPQVGRQQVLQFRPQVGRRDIRNVQFENQDGHRDGENRIAERDGPLQFGALGDQPHTRISSRPPPTGTVIRSPTGTVASDPLRMQRRPRFPHVHPVLDRREGSPS